MPLVAPVGKLPGSFDMFPPLKRCHPGTVPPEEVTPMRVESHDPSFSPPDFIQNRLLAGQSFLDQS